MLYIFVCMLVMSIDESIILFVSSILVRSYALSFLASTVSSVLYCAHTNYSYTLEFDIGCTVLL